MKSVTPTYKFDNRESVRELVDKVINDPTGAENLVILLRLVTNPDRSQTENWISLDEAIKYAFSLTDACDEAISKFIAGRPLKVAA